MKYLVVPRDTNRGGCYSCISEALLKFLGSVSCPLREAVTASQTGPYLPQFVL